MSKHSRKFPERKLSKCLCFPWEKKLRYGRGKVFWQAKQKVSTQSALVRGREEGTVTGNQVYRCEDRGGRWASQKSRTWGLLCQINTNTRNLWFQYPVRWTGCYLPHSPGYALFFFPLLFFSIWEAFLAAFWLHSDLTLKWWCDVTHQQPLTYKFLVLMPTVLKLSVGYKHVIREYSILKHFIFLII